MKKAWQHGPIVFLIVSMVLTPIGRPLSPVYAADAPAVPPPEVPPQAGGAYSPSGIPIEELPPQYPLVNLNLRLPAQDPDEAGQRIAAILRERQEGRSALQSSAEIEALAAGLDHDPRLIYEYVLNNYDVLPIWGWMKNARETYLAKRGNPLDLAVLLSDLLRASGYETMYAICVIRLPMAQALNWVGADTPGALLDILYSGGNYADLDGDVLRLKHVVVGVKVDNTWYSLDPSFEAYTYTQGLDLGAVLGYDRDSFLNAALSGATVTNDYVEHLNTGNINARLTQYATNLAQHLRESSPFASLAEVVGGRRIVPQTINTLPTELPYTVQSVLGTLVDLPLAFQYRLHVELSGLDYWASLPEIAGDRLTITYVGATEADRAALAAAGGITGVYPAYRINMVPELRIGGALVATGSSVSLGSGQPLTMTVSVPYDIAGVPVVWPFRPRQLFVGAFYVVPISLEGISEEALRRHQALLQDARAAGLAEDSEPVRGESLYVLGLSYFNQIEASGRLDAALARMVFAPQMFALVTSQDYLVAEWVQVGGVQQPARIGLGSYGLDYKLGRWTTISASGDHEQERAFWGHFDAKNTAAEHAIIEQLQNKPAVSAIRVLDLANSQGVRVYRLVSETVEALLPNLDYRSALKDELRQYVASGNVVVVPQHRLTYNQWRGTGWLLYDPSYGSVGGVMDGSMVVAQGEPAEVRPTMGGNGTIVGEINVDTLL
jgi:hypothetical protein